MQRCLNCQSNFRLKVFLLFLTPTAVSFFVYSFFCFSHASVLPDFLNWLFTLPPLRMPPHVTLCSSLCVSASVVLQSCSSTRVPAVVFQHLRLSSRVPAVVFQHLRFIICDSAVVFQHSCSSRFQHLQSCFSIYVSSSVIQQLCFSILFQQSCFSICVQQLCFVFQQSCFSISVIQPTSVFALVLQHLCSCFSNCVPASAIVFQLLCSNTCACSITNRLSSMTTLTICVSFCVPTLFQHCVSASVFAFVLQRLCFSFCVPASVLHTQSIAINDNLDHLRHLCCSHISNKNFIILGRSLLET
jgi:hypothetical protein